MGRSDTLDSGMEACLDHEPFYTCYLDEGHISTPSKVEEACRGKPQANRALEHKLIQDWARTKMNS